MALILLGLGQLSII